MTKYRLEYIWLDGYTPVPNLRGKTQIKEYASFPKLEELPLWGFDGSSTNQATGESSDCELQPVFVCPDPIRGGDNVLVLCDVHLARDDKPHPTNTRHTCAKTAKKYAKHEMIFGIEQEYMEILGIRVPHIIIPVRPGRDLARLIEVAALQVKVREGGHNAGAVFSQRVQKQIDAGNGGSSTGAGGTQSADG